MSDNMYRRVLLRRRFCKKSIIIVVIFIISFYGSILLLGDLKSPVVMHLTELERCPVCFGVSVCPELYSNQIVLESRHRWTNIFNAKNIFYGFTKTKRKVVLKKLAHDYEFKIIDKTFCNIWNLKPNCKPSDLKNATGVNKLIQNIVNYNTSNTLLDVEPKTGLVMCPYYYSIYELIELVLGEHKKPNDLINIWTMLTINPEPIIIQLIPKSKGWPVPAYGGVCGRLEIVAYEGERLSLLLDADWYRKLKFAKKIIDAAMDFTFKHDRFRFYLMDWSLDNIVANDNDEITFVDLEDVIVLDKHILPKNDLPDWYKRYIREKNIPPGFTFSISNICTHHLSDHNLWAACYVLVADETPLLYPIPTFVNKSRPHFDRLLNECLYGDNRFQTINKLQHIMMDMLLDKEITRLQ